jgi:hypothetical protein
MKRIHEGDYAEEPVEEQVKTSRPFKRRKSNSLSPELHDSVDVVLDGTQRDPLEIVSTSSMSSDPQLPQDEGIGDGLHARNVSTEEPLGSDLDIDGLEGIAPPEPIDLGSDEYPSNTPTPRASRHKATAFDTQAILSSPSQAFSLEALRPLALPTSLIEEDEDELPYQSPLFHPEFSDHEPESEASTTHSLQEFRRSINTEEETSLHSLAPLTQPPQSSIRFSSPTSTDSLDPDPPLEPSEFDLFFDEQHAAGYTDNYISAALKHTRFRPDLAIEVLTAWKDGEPLPNVRGVWSKEDDDDVMSGKADALRRVERKHTCDGWGGITERMKFLECYRDREEAMAG